MKSIYFPSVEGETRSVYFQNGGETRNTKRGKSLFVLWRRRWRLRKDLCPIKGQAWQKGDDSGLVALWGLSATHKSPTWKSYKDWHWLWHRAIGPDKPFVWK